MGHREQRQEMALLGLTTLVGQRQVWAGPHLAPNLWEPRVPPRLSQE